MFLKKIKISNRYTIAGSLTFAKCTAPLCSLREIYVPSNTTVETVVRDHFKKEHPILSRFVK